MKIKKYYFLSPWFVTGGPECIHQACGAFNDLGYESSIVYTDKISKEPIEVYRQYNLKVETDIIDEEYNLVVYPEYFNPQTDIKVQKAKKAYYWLSKDNASWNPTKEKLKNIDYHLCQSKYVYDYLINELQIDKIKVYMFTDYTKSLFIESEPFLINCKNIKQNYILFNPAKGIEHTNEIINELKEVQNVILVPLRGMTPDQIKQIALRSKIYIDFGNHPGKDRMPREMAASGCYIIVGKRGSAINDNDIPIQSVLKIEMNSFGSFDYRKIKDEILNIINNFDEKFENSIFYRDLLRNEKKNFYDEVEKFVENINEI